MKKIFPLSIVFILLTCTFNQTSAQNYIPLLNDSLFWDVGIANNDVTFCQEYGYAGNGPYRYRTARDTVFNSITYKMFAVYPFHKVYPSYPYNCSPFYVDTLSAVMINGPYLREDTALKKVFILDSVNATERIMFDFSAQIGDTIHYPVYGDFIVDTIVNYVTLDGISRKVFETAKNYIPFSPNFYIEGIGGASGLFFDPFAYFEGGLWLMCVSSLNQTLIGSGNCYSFASGSSENVIAIHDKKLFPNPVINVLTVNSVFAGSEFIIYDNCGKIVFNGIADNESHVSVTTLSHGFYFLCLNEHGLLLPIGSFIKL